MKELYCVCVIILPATLPAAAEPVAEIIPHLVHEDGAICASGDAAIISGRLDSDAETIVFRNGMHTRLGQWSEYVDGSRELWTRDRDAADAIVASFKKDK